MSRMNSRNRKKFFDLIVQRDGGAYCFIGGEPLTFETAVIDHLDNDNSNNRLDNLGIICISMNAVKDCRGVDRRHRLLSPMCGNIFSGMIDSQQEHQCSPELKKSLQAGPDFRHWLFWKVMHFGKVSFDVALDAGSAFARCSQETARRYLKQEISEERLYEECRDPETNEKMIIFKPEFKFLRRKREEKEKMIQTVKNWKEIMREDAMMDKAAAKSVKKAE